MKRYYTWFLKKFNFPKDAVEYLTLCYNKIYKDKSFYKEFIKIINGYKKDINFDFSKMIVDVKALVGTNNVHQYTRVLIMLIIMSKYLKTWYKKNNLPMPIWKNSMNDLLYKCIECYLVYGVWGTFVDWFGKFYNLTRFALGRLQFDMINLPMDIKCKEISLKKGDKALEVHIPRTGTRLDKSELVNSYKTAVEFFKNYFGKSRVVFFCDSWILYPPLKQMLFPQSNLLAFISDYEIVESGIYKDFTSDSWRLYDTKEKDLDKLPQNSSLRKNYVEYLKAGGKFGWGHGVYIYQK